MAVENILEQVSHEKTATVPAKFEKPSNPEAKTEKILTRSEKLPEVIAAADKKNNGIASPVTLVQDFQKQRAVAIDSILSEGLNEIFLQMKEQEQKDFKKKGEETVAKINALLNQTKVKVNKIISLIREWLKMIPGVNKFFLEQEVKIKADKILKIKDKF